MKLKNWLIAAGFLVPFVACTPAKAVNPDDPVGNVIGNYCKNIIEESMGKFVFTKSREEKIKLVKDLSKCIEVPETHEELEQKLINEGYIYRQNLFGKITEPIKTVVDNGNKYDVIIYKPLTSIDNSFDNPSAFNVYRKIFVNEKAVKDLVGGVFELYKVKDLDVFSVRINKKFYNSLKGKDDKETWQNLYNDIFENYVQHELEHLRNKDEGNNVPSEVKAYVGSFIRAPSYNTFIDLDYLEGVKDSICGKAGKRIFDLFEVHGVPKKKIPDMSLEELKKVAEEIYKEL